MGADRRLRRRRRRRGETETGLTRAHLARPGMRDAVQALVPAGPPDTPAGHVGPALFFSAGESAFGTGQVLHADGGRTLV
ncbi:hypothetical protein ACIRPX_39900 [Streptomyces sp. NPDC101225]|uniref:hypothetical protein n=1 Tax=Streptomyces sp. NPDC101225 TaxID=3366135 RepID=UPI003806BCB6